jgi:RNase adaptor protein for sRNA GlmZ degradation
LSVLTFRKTIAVRSFGFLFTGKVPRIPAWDSGIIFHLEDIRLITPDPQPAFRLSALDAETYQAIISQPEVRHFLENEKTYLNMQMQRLLSSEEFHTLQINYGSLRGYHRSVAFAIWAHQFIGESGYRQGLTIEHLTLKANR